MRAEDNLTEAPRIERFQNEQAIDVHPCGGMITQGVMNERLRWEHRGVMPVAGFGQNPAGQQQRRPLGMLDSGTTIPVPGAPSGAGTVVPDDSISVAQRLSPPNVVDYRLDSEAQADDYAMLVQDDQVIRTMEHIHQAQAERAKAYFSFHGRNVVSNAERAQSERECMYTEKLRKLQRRSLMCGIVGDLLERSAGRRIEEELRAQQRRLDEAFASMENERLEREEMNRQRARGQDGQTGLAEPERSRADSASRSIMRSEQFQRSHARNRHRDRGQIRGLGVTDTNMTDFDIDAVNEEQANIPPRTNRRQEDTLPDAQLEASMDERRRQNDGSWLEWDSELDG